MFYENPIIEEIKEEYRAKRAIGLSRSATVSELRQLYSNELNDSDDGPYVKIALALALSKSHELTNEIADDAINALELLKNTCRGNEKRICAARKIILNEASYGDEKVVRPKKRFCPGWNNGDTFVHIMNSNCAESCGLKKWGVIIRKVGDYVNNKNKEVQIVTLSLCPPELLDAIPDNIDSLGFLRMMPVGSGKNDYLAQMIITKRDNENAFELTKIGCFPVEKLPADQYNPDIRVARPLFCLKNSDGCIHYEEVACSSFADNGIIK